MGQIELHTPLPTQMNTLGVKKHNFFSGADRFYTSLREDQAIYEFCYMKLGIINYR